MVRFADLENGPSPESSGNGQARSNVPALPTYEAASSHNAISPVSEKNGEELTGESSTVLENIRSAAESAKRRLHLSSIQATGPSKRFNPTNVRMQVRWGDDVDGRGQDTVGKLRSQKEATVLWRSRDNRKGRNSVAVPQSTYEPPKRMARFLSGAREIGKTILQMCTSFPYWDMAFWSGWSYTVGSILFVMDGAFAWGPIAFPETEWEGEGDAVGLLFFIGALFYQVGATMAYLEAVNDGSFQGSAMRRLLEGNEEEQKKMMDSKIHDFFGHFVPHPRRKREAENAETLANAVDPEAGWESKDRRERPGSLYPPTKKPAPRRGGIDYGEAEEGEVNSTYVSWRWWPTWYSLKTHHVYEIGYLACAIQLFGATLYGMCGVIALPGIFDTLEQWQANACYWIPQIVASVCFLTASLLFTVETQEKWYKPEFKLIGWWIGLWATVGSMGFLLSGSLGPASENYSASYQSSLSSMWGSAGYLLSSLLQWYEAINKRPALNLFNE